MNRNENTINVNDPAGAGAGSTYDAFLARDRLAGSLVAQKMRSLEHPGINIISNFDDIHRGEMGGYNIRAVGAVRELFPRLSRADYESIVLSQLPEVPGGIDYLMDGMTGMSHEARANIASTRKLAVQTMPDGSVRYIIVPAARRFAGEVDVVDFEEGYTELDEYRVPSAAELASRAKSRTYTLNQVFDDAAIADKFQFPARIKETAKRQAVTDPSAAARTLQDFMNARQSTINVTVSAGKSMTNRSLAASTLRTVGSQYVRSQTTIESLVMGDLLILYGPEGLDDWYVSGPLKYANELSYVYWMLFHDGLIVPNILFSAEFTILGFDVYDRYSLEEPPFKFHAGSDVDVPVGMSPATSAELTSAQRIGLERLACSLHPIDSSTGGQLATAVQVTGKHAIINAHAMLADPRCRLGEGVIEVRQQLSKDMLCVKSVGDAPPWTLRDGVLTEWVTICYLAEGKLSCTNPLQLVSMQEETLVLSMDTSVGPGLSGGAIVALSDLALLGIHSGATRNNLLAYRFGDAQFSKLLEADSVSTISRSEDPSEFALRVDEFFRNKGLGGVFTAAVESLVAVYVDNMHVGSAVQSGTRLFTTCDPTLHLTYGDSRTPLVMEKVGVGALYSAESQFVTASPVFRRAPNYFESVFVVGSDGEPYITTTTEVAHIGPDSSSFVIRDVPGADRPLTGGIVLGFDGAFLGVCGPRRVDTAIGLGHMCWPVRGDVVVPQSPRGVLARKFPFLNIQAWPDQLIQEVFTHSSVGEYSSGRVFNAGCKPLANIGDSVLKTLFWSDLRTRSVPHSAWQSRLQRHQTNAIMSEAAWSSGIAKCVVVGAGAELPRDSKAYADVVEALVGAASIVERSDVVEKLVRALKLMEEMEVERDM